tara:strand:- start:983 stop:1663 length:681 start_codon:yes stop_codon:yes gene_type:complete
MQKINSNMEDPIYAIARKRKREWEAMAKKVKSVEPVGETKTGVAKPYNLRTQRTFRVVSSRMSDGDFHEHQVAAYCGLHAIHNLIRGAEWPTVQDMNKAAEECAKESGDNIYNHKSFSGFWSMDTVRRVLKEGGYEVKCGVTTKTIQGEIKYYWNIPTMYSLLADDNVLGFIIHQPQHYTALRKQLDKKDWQYSNSYNKEAGFMNPHEFCKQALEGVWNIYLVSKK